MIRQPIFKPLCRLSFIILVLLSSQLSYAGNLQMVRVAQAFPETMTNLQQAIKATGYTISRVQRVDIGLTKSGYQTDKYRVVFFGKADEIREISQQHPDMIPYLPLKISIFSENSDTMLVTIDLALISRYLDNPPTELFKRWQHDIDKILQLTKNAD